MRYTHVFLAASLTLAACSSEGDDEPLLTETPAGDVAAAGDVATSDAEVDTDSGDKMSSDNEAEPAGSNDTVDEVAVVEPVSPTEPLCDADCKAEIAEAMERNNTTTTTTTQAPTTTRSRPSTTTTWKGLQVPENAGTLPAGNVGTHPPPETTAPTTTAAGDPFQPTTETPSGSIYDRRPDEECVAAGIQRPPVSHAACYQNRNTEQHVWIGY